MEIIFLAYSNCVRLQEITHKDYHIAVYLNSFLGCIKMPQFSGYYKELVDNFKEFNYDVRAVTVSNCFIIYIAISQDKCTIEKNNLKNAILNIKKFQVVAININNSAVFDILIELFREKNIIHDKVLFDLIFLPFKLSYAFVSYSNLVGLRKEVVDKMINAGLFDKFLKSKRVKRDENLIKRLQSKK